jgi:hypothetical protein
VFGVDAFGPPLWLRGRIALLELGERQRELEVNYQLEFCWLFDRDVGRFLSFENAGALSNARQIDLPLDC